MEHPPRPRLPRRRPRTGVRGRPRHGPRRRVRDGEPVGRGARPLAAHPRRRHRPLTPVRRGRPRAPGARPGAGPGGFGPPAPRGPRHGRRGPGAARPQLPARPGAWGHRDAAGHPRRRRRRRRRVGLRRRDGDAADLLGRGCCGPPRGERRSTRRSPARRRPVAWRRCSTGPGSRTSPAGCSTSPCTSPEFDDYWDPFLLGIGPAGDFTRELDDTGREALRTELRDRLGEGPVEMTSVARWVRGVVPG